MNTEIKVGDYVTVIEEYEQLPAYHTWAVNHGLYNFHVSIGGVITKGGFYKVVVIGECGYGKDRVTLLGIEDKQKFQFVIGKNGVRKLEPQQPTKTISKESFLSLVRQDIGQEEASDVYVDIQKFLLIPTVEYVHLTKYDEFDIFYNNREYSGKGLERLYEVMNNIISLEN